MPTTFATLETTKGAIRVRLFPDTAPKTVENFVGLATGSRPWRDPASGQEQQRPLYDGTVFHRVIPDFMIQGGDPTGTGSGGPGYTFEDEFNDHKVERGALAMANAGPNTNGSQFFICHQDLTGKLPKNYTLFGQVTKGMDVVDKIVGAPRDARDLPTDPVAITGVTIHEE